MDESTEETRSPPVLNRTEGRDDYRADILRLRQSMGCVPVKSRTRSSGCRGSEKGKRRLTHPFPRPSKMIEKI